MRYLERHSYASISLVEGVTYSTVRDIVQRRIESGDYTFESRPPSGQTKKTSNRDDEALVRYALENLIDTLDALASPFKSSI